MSISEPILRDLRETKYDIKSIFHGAYIPYFQSETGYPEIVIHAQGLESPLKIRLENCAYVLDSSISTPLIQNISSQEELYTAARTIQEDLEQYRNLSDGIQEEFSAATIRHENVHHFCEITMGTSTIDTKISEEILENINSYPRSLIPELNAVLTNIYTARMTEEAYAQLQEFVDLSSDNLSVCSINASMAFADIIPLLVTPNYNFDDSTKSETLLDYFNRIVTYGRVSNFEGTSDLAKIMILTGKLELLHEIHNGIITFEDLYNSILVQLQNYSRDPDSFLRNRVNNMKKQIWQQIEQSNRGIAAFVNKHQDLF